MDFKKYQHIEKIGTVETDRIIIGTCYIFPKIDGTNASIWIDNNGNIATGSRTRTLSDEKDNANFHKSVLSDDPQFDGIKEFICENPEYRIFGEWLVPHTLKTYREDAWRKFYLFDLVIEDEEGFKYVPYPEYKKICDKYNINYIPCLQIIKNPTYDNLLHVVNQNNYLIEEGKGIGEGVVVKNYDFVNKFGRTTWGKIVTSEFKEKHYKEMGSPEKENKLIEEDIANEFCTTTLIEKTYAKIVNENDGWSSKYIPRLLETVYHDLVVEDIYNVLKKYKFPTINFKTLRTFVTLKIKEIKKELF